MSNPDTDVRVFSLFERFQSSNLPHKLEVLNTLQEYLYERHHRKNGNESIIADHLLVLLHNESNIDVVEEVLVALFNLTEGMYLPDARWKFLAERLPGLKTAQQQEYALTLMAQSLDICHIPLLQEYVTAHVNDVAQAAKNSIEEIEFFDAKTKLAEKMHIVLQPFILTPVVKNVYEVLCKELLPIFNFELQFGNSVERIDHKKWDNVDLVVVFQKPFFFKKSKLHQHLKRMIEHTEFRNPHYKMEADTYFVKEYRQAISGPLQ